ncbi:MAG: hypothetical protein LC620_01660 [Halobacteriales archaeon]|nr:hypothetical protein [Halobacteriales archaeon]
MRFAAALLLLALSGCTGAGPGSGGPLPQDFTITQPAGAGITLDGAYGFHFAGSARVNATLVWGTEGNVLELSIEPSGDHAQVAGTVAHLERTLAPGDYRLRVAGTPKAADTWHLEAHFTR